MAENKFEEWLATMMKGGQARPNRFECIINFPATIQANMVSQLPRDFTFRINSVSFPGKNIRTTTDENIYGPSYEVAQGLTYGEEISIEFYLRNTHEERWVFNSWQDYIVAPDSYNVEYYKNYVADIEVYQLDEQNNRTAGIKIKNCFPKTLKKRLLQEEVRLHLVLVLTHLILQGFQTQVDQLVQHLMTNSQAVKKVYLRMLVKHLMTYWLQEIRLCLHNKKFWRSEISLKE